MQRLPHLLLCLLCALLPAQAGARVPRVPAPCPMMQAPAMAPASTTARADDCCEHGGPAGGASAACQTDQECHCGGPGLPMACVVGVRSPRSALQPLAMPLPTAAFYPSTVWRPPTPL